MSVSYVSEGCVVVEQNNRKYSVHKEHVLIGSFGVDRIINAGPEGYWHSRYITLSGDAAEHISAILGLTDRVMIKCNNPIVIAKKMKRIISIVTNKAENFEEKASTEAYGLLLELANQGHTSPPPEILTILRFIEENLHRTISIKELASLIHASEVTVNRLFKKYVGIPPVAFHIDKRLQAACAMLRNSNSSIKQIAHALGFDDPNYFTARFSKYIGSSPKQYRNCQQNG